MEENTNLTAELNADQQEAFLDGWGDEPTEVEEAADQQTEQAEEQAGQADLGEGPEATENAEGEGKDGEAESATKDAGEPGAAEAAGQQQAAATWTVKHMDQTRTMGVNDITPELLQKGMDYDRIRAKYDEAKPVMEMFTQFAQKAGMSVADYAKFIRTEAKKAGGMNEADAKRTVELEDREAAVTAAEAQQQAAADKKEEGKARIQADLAEFSKAFPTVYEKAKSDPKAIPAQVWKDVNAGLSLTAAYARYAVAQAQQAQQAADNRAATAAQNQTNARRTTGSMKSAGNDAKNTDDFLEGFGS